MSSITIIVTPPGGSPQDITDSVIFGMSTFQSQFNGVPGSFDISVRDPDQTLSFATGWEIQLTVDTVTMFGGYITQVGMTSLAPAADTSDLGNYDLRTWHLSGADYNIALDRRIYRDTGDYLTSIRINEVIDGQILTSAIENYADMDDFSTAGINNVATIPDVDYVTLQQGWVVRKEFETLLPFSGAVYYIDGDKTIVWKAYDDAEKRWGFSDTPNSNPITVSPAAYQGALYGFSSVEGTQDSTMLGNDIFVWGGSEFAGSGGTVFHRSTDTDSIDDHGRWQHPETHFGESMYKSTAGVTAVANAILDGPPGTDATGQEKGLKRPQWQFDFTWFSNRVPELSGVRDHIRAGDLVTINLAVFGVTRLLPVRNLRISFPDAFEDDNTHLVQFDGTFGLQLSDSFTLWRYILQNQNRVKIQTQQVVSSGSGDTSFGAHYGGNVLPEPDGTTTVFSLPFGYITGTTQVWVNGVLQVVGTDYSESNNEAGQITFAVAPLVTDVIQATAFTLTGASTAIVPAGALYISADGNDSTGDGSEGNPWASLDKFFTEAAGSTCVCLAGGGSFTGSLNHNLSLATYGITGSLGNPITIMAKPGEAPVFDGEANGTSDDNVFWMVATGDISYFAIIGITLINFSMTQNGIITLSNQDVGGSISDWSFTNFSLQQVAPADPSAQGIYLGERFTGLHVSNSIFLGPYPSGSVNGGAGISAYSEDSAAAPHDVNIDHSIFSGWYGAGVQFYTDTVDGQITHNTFVGNRTNIELHGSHGPVLVRNNALATAPNGSIIDGNSGATTADHNFESQTFSAEYFLVPGNTGIKAATDGTDAGARNS